MIKNKYIILGLTGLLSISLAACHKPDSSKNNKATEETATSVKNNSGSKSKNKVKNTQQVYQQFFEGKILSNNKYPGKSFLYFAKNDDGPIMLDGQVIMATGVWSDNQINLNNVKLVQNGNMITATGDKPTGSAIRLPFKMKIYGDQVVINGVNEHYTLKKGTLKSVEGDNGQEPQIKHNNQNKSTNPMVKQIRDLIDQANGDNNKVTNNQLQHFMDRHPDFQSYDGGSLYLELQKAFPQIGGDADAI